MSSGDFIEFFVGGLILDPNTQAPVLILNDESGSLSLPIWIGVPEATGIASAVNRVSLARPLTHDLLHHLLGELDVTVKQIAIVDLQDSTYIAELTCLVGERTLVVDCRPSDAINIALRAEAPIFIAQVVLDKAQLISQPEQGAPDEESSDEGAPGQELGSDEAEAAEGSEGDLEGADGAVNQVQTDISGVDKDKWAEILKSLDPDDFKYRT